MCVGFFGYARNLFPCAQPGDSGVFLRLWSNGGVLHCNPLFHVIQKWLFSNDLQFAVAMVGVRSGAQLGDMPVSSGCGQKGVYVIALRLFYVMWEWRNFNDLGLYAGMVCVRGRPLSGDMPVSSGWGRGGPACSESFTQCMKRTFAIHGMKRLAVRIFEVSCGFQMNCVDSGLAVWILARSCGFLRTCADSSWGYSARWDRNRRFLALKGPFPAGFGLRTVRTTCRKSARSDRNPHGSLKIRRALQESARFARSPHD